MKSTTVKPGDIDRKWHHIEVGQTPAGRLATQVASLLRGKGKVNFSYHADVGDFVVITGVEKLRITGKKETDKKYYRHSLYPGGIKSQTFEERKDKAPDKLFKDIVKGMLPNNKLRQKMLNRLKIVTQDNNPYNHLISS